MRPITFKRRSCNRRVERKRSKIIGITKGVGIKKVKALLGRFQNRRGIKSLVTDGYKPFETAVRQSMPRRQKITVTADKRHVLEKFRLAGARVLRARQKTKARKQTKKKRRSLRRQRKVFNSRLFDLSPKDRRFCDKMLANDPIIAKAHALKEKPHHMYQFKDKKDARAVFAEIKYDVKTAPDSVQREFKKAVNYAKNLGNRLFNYFDKRRTTASSEANNALAKGINRDGRRYGRKNFERKAIALSGYWTPEQIALSTRGKLKPRSMSTGRRKPRNRR